MAATAVRAGIADWRRVAQHVSNRTRDLGSPTDAELIRRAGSGLSLPVLSRIRNAARESYSVRSLTALCRALGWSADSIHRIIEGGEAVVLDDDEVEAAPDQVAERFDRIEDILAKVQAQLAVIQQENRELREARERDGRERPAS